MIAGVLNKLTCCPDSGAVSAGGRRMAWLVETRFPLIFGLVTALVTTVEGPPGLTWACVVALNTVLVLAPLGSKPLLGDSFRAGAFGMSNTCSPATVSYTSCDQQHVVGKKETLLKG